MLTFVVYVWVGKKIIFLRGLNEEKGLFGGRLLSLIYCNYFFMQ